MFANAPNWICFDKRERQNFAGVQSLESHGEGHAKPLRRSSEASGLRHHAASRESNLVDSKP